MKQKIKKQIFATFAILAVVFAFTAIYNFIMLPYEMEVNHAVNGMYSIIAFVVCLFIASCINVEDKGNYHGRN